MQLDLSSMSPNQIYFTFIQTIIPRPIAWVLSDNGDSSFNLAPFSYFNGVCSDPPLIMLSIGKKPDGSLKDTRLNIAERSDFVVHIVHRELAEQVTESSRGLPHGESELSRLGLTTTPFEGSRLPRLEGPRIAFACEKERIIELGNTPQGLILGLVKQVWIDDAVAEETDGRLTVHADRVDPLGRLGFNDYSLFGEQKTVPRPK